MTVIIRNSGNTEKIALALGLKGECKCIYVSNDGSMGNYEYPAPDGTTVSMLWYANPYLKFDMIRVRTECEQLFDTLSSMGERFPDTVQEVLDSIKFPGIHK